MFNKKNQLKEIQDFLNKNDFKDFYFKSKDLELKICFNEKKEDKIGFKIKDTSENTGYSKVSDEYIFKA